MRTVSGTTVERQALSSIAHQFDEVGDETIGANEPRRPVDVDLDR
jgi:hypothetical protein